jgi:phage replication-related protein YjqB (UPF0714/DUF867 family)
MAIDRYSSYADLKATERQGIDYSIVSLDRHSPVTIIAPHGGQIEPPTSTLAIAIAADDYNAYCFDGLRTDRQHHELHITSQNFDEPIGRELIAKSDIVIALHGRRDREAPKSVWIGGLDGELCYRIASYLGRAGFQAATEGHEFPALDLANICNRGRRKKGAQLEIPRSLRDILSGDTEVFNRFANAIRLSIADAVRAEAADSIARQKSESQVDRSLPSFATTANPNADARRTLTRSRKA